jgi:hypothetical protein
VGSANSDTAVTDTNTNTLVANADTTTANLIPSLLAIGTRPIATNG